MSHTHGPSAHVGARYRTRLLIVFVLVVIFMVAEVIAAIVSGSLALLADAGHMTADAVTLGAAYVATRVAARRDTTGTRTYGSFRAEIFASGFAVLVMLGVAAFVAVEAVGRIGAPAEISTTPMLVVGVIGLAVNAVSMLILRAGARESLNVKGAYLEVIADAAGSVGVIVAGALILMTGNGVWDVVVGLAIAVFVAVRAVVLGKEVLAVLGQHAPRGFDTAAAVTDLQAVEGVLEVHDLHAWTLTSGMNVATAHLMVATRANSQTVLAKAQAILSDRHDIAHATLQVESATSPQCEEVSW